MLSLGLDGQHHFRSLSRFRSLSVPLVHVPSIFSNIKTLLQIDLLQLNSRQRRSRERARQWHAARVGVADVHSCTLPAATVAAHARWRRLAAAALRYSAWRPWAAARAGTAAAAAPVPASRNMLMDTVQGRVALADAMVAQVEAPGRPKRKAAELANAG